MIKFYCHYDITTLKIVQVGGCQACDLQNDNIKTLEIPFDPIGKSIINGDTGIDDWEIVKTIKTNCLTLSIDPIGKSIINGDTGIDDWEIVKTIKTNCLTLSKKSKNNKNVVRLTSVPLLELNNNGECVADISIFVTNKNDPTILLSRNDNIKKWKISKDFSVFTDRFKILN